jgi:hypothetical protein
MESCNEEENAWRAVMKKRTHGELQTSRVPRARVGYSVGAIYRC